MKGDRVVNEFIKLGVEENVKLVVLSFNWVGRNQHAPSRWRQFLFVTLF